MIFLGAWLGRAVSSPWTLFTSISAAWGEHAGKIVCGSTAKATPNTNNGKAVPHLLIVFMNPAPFLPDERPI
jgi:hypothetical protein